MGAAGRTGTSGPNRGSRCSAPGPPAADRQDESAGRGRALRRQLGGYGGDGSPNGVNQRQGGLRCELDSDASRGPLGGIRKVDVQGVQRRSVHRVVVVDRRGAKREPAGASFAATRDRRLLGGVGAVSYTHLTLPTKRIV